MKILYFHQHFTTPNEAGGTRSYEFARKLLLCGHSVSMVCGKTVELNLPKVKKNIHRGNVDGIDVIQIALPYSNKDSILKRTLIFIRFAFIGIRIALEEKYDLLFSTTTPLTAGIPGIAAKFFRRKKFVFEVRDLWPELPKALGMKNPFLILGMSFLEWLSYRSADACIGLSPGICEGIKKKSQKGKSVKMIPNGCDLDLFKPSSRELLSLEGMKQTDIVAVYTGTHGIANGLDAILDAAGILKEKGRNDIVLAFIGDGKVKEKLLFRANKESLDNCKFFSSVSKKELCKIIPSVDIGMMVLANVPAFYYGTSPNKFFDYIACGLPVINNYPGWLAEMVTENKLGIVVPPDSPNAFADAIIELADNITRRKNAGKNAREFAENNFSRDNLSTEFVKFLETTYNS
jgi:glycosyltransferase involved in cell wall biosynthesis